MPTTNHNNTDGNTPGSYYYLYYTGYNANSTNFLNAFSAALSGSYYNGGANYNTTGGFWSATAYNTAQSHFLHIYEGYDIEGDKPSSSLLVAGLFESADIASDAYLNKIIISIP